MGTNCSILPKHIHLCIHTKRRLPPPPTHSLTQDMGEPRSDEPTPVAAQARVCHRDGLQEEGEEPQPQPGPPAEAAILGCGFGFGEGEKGVGIASIRVV